MKYSLATGANELAVKRLLAANELPHSDITLAHLKHFMLGFDGPTMVAVGGA